MTSAYEVCILSILEAERLWVLFNQIIMRENRIMPEKMYKRVFENNRKWAEEHLSGDEDFFENLAKGQSPEFLYIGCSDSRVPATHVMGLDPGQAFVHRNIANVVPNTDQNVHSVIQYAVDHLMVEHIVVCGHYGCGGVAAAMQSDDLGLLNGWLREIRDVYRLHADELNAIEDEEARYKRLIEINVLEQCNNVLKTSWVQKQWLRRKGPIVHGWVFDISTGLLKDLDFPHEKAMEKIREIYHLDV